MISLIVLSYFIDVFGEGKFISGLIMGVIESMSFFFKVVFGYVSDCFKKRKVFVFIGYVFLIFVKGVLVFICFWWDFLMLRVFDRIGKGIRMVLRDVLIVELSEKGKSGKFFGFYRMMDMLGVVVGLFVVIGIFKFFEGLLVEKVYCYVFLLLVVLGLILFLVILFFVKDRGVEVKKKIIGILMFRDRNL